MKSVFGFCVRLGNPDLDVQNLNPDFPIERTLGWDIKIGIFLAVARLGEFVRDNASLGELRRDKGI